MGKVLPDERTFKCTEFVPYTVDFVDGNDREGSFLRLYDKFLLLKYDHINLGPHELDCINLLLSLEVNLYRISG